jgi:HSP20 family protein
MLRYTISPHRLAQHYAALTEGRTPQVHIPMEVRSDADGFSIRAFLPGVAADDLTIEVLEDTVSISGELPAFENSEDVKVLLAELPAGSFQRTLRLPAQLDAAKAEAEVVDGMLMLRVPVAESAKARQIKIKSK